LATAPRCGAQTRRQTPCRAPAMTNGRCRMHGGGSTGPRTLAGLGRLRAATTRHGRCTAVERAVERWRRRYVANGYKSAGAMPEARARMHFLMRAGEAIPERLIAEMRQVARETVARQDAERPLAVCLRRDRRAAKLSVWPQSGASASADALVGEHAQEEESRRRQ
jgi:hypothetical protein